MSLVKDKMSTLNELGLSLDNRSKSTDPNWLTQLRQTATEKFKSLGFPTKKWENWRYMDLDPVLKTAFQSVDSDQQTNQPNEPNIPAMHSDDAIIVQITNGVPNLEANASKINGLSILPFSQIDEPAIDIDIENEKNPFAVLNASQMTDGVCISVDENIKVTQPIHIILNHTDSTENQLSHPRVAIKMNKGSAVDVVLSIGEQNGVDFNNLVVDLHVDDNASLNYISTNPEGIDGYRFETSRLVCKNDAKAELYYISKGSALTKFDSKITLIGENSSCNINGFSLLADDNHLYSDTVAHHTKPNCVSDQIFKNILTGQAQSEFITLVKIYKDAQKNYTNQTNNNLLLSSQARALSRPQLEIDADDVKCNHGATMGQLDEEQINYLMCRGLSRETARYMLTRGFIEEIINTIPIEFVKQYFQDNIDKDLNKILTSN